MVVLAEGSKLLFVPEAGHFPVHTAPLAQCAWGTSSQSEVADEAGDGGGEPVVVVVMVMMVMVVTGW